MGNLRENVFADSAAIAGALVLVSSNALIQVLPNLRDLEPGSQLFGVLHLLIGTSSAAAAFGVLMRALGCLVRRREWSRRRGAPRFAALV